MNKFTKKSKILYLSDTYTINIAGTKISIFNEMRRRGYEIKFHNIHTASRNKIDGGKLLKQLKQGKFTHLWLSHTWCEFVGCTREQINNLGISILGFGFSDPYDWNPSKLLNYNYYATNHLFTYNKIKNRINSIYFPTACDKSFHKNLKIPKTTDILIYGVGIHPRFKPTKYRLNMVSKLQKIFRDKTIKVFGRKWGKINTFGFLDHEKFLVEINKAKISLDLQQDWCPLAHRMFECMASGTVAITRRRNEVEKILKDRRDILMYDNINDLSDTIKYFLDKDKERSLLSKQMYINTRKNNNISNRVSNLIKWLNKL